MQLILETNDAILNVEEKMSALKENPIDEKLTLNGDVEKSHTETNGKLEANENGNSDKEIILSKDVDVTAVKENGTEKEVVEVPSNDPVLEDVDVSNSIKLDGSGDTAALVDEPTLQSSTEISVVQNNCQPVVEELIAPKQIEKSSEDLTDTISDVENKESQNDIAQDEVTNKSESMDVDESLETSSENFEPHDLEKDVTNSISALVNDIVKDLDVDMSENNLDDSSEPVAVENSVGDPVVSLKDSCKLEKSSPEKEIVHEATVQLNAVTCNTELSDSDNLKVVVSSDSTEELENNIISVAKDVEETADTVKSNKDDIETTKMDIECTDNVKDQNITSNEEEIMQQKSEANEMIDSQSENEKIECVRMETDTVETLETKSLDAVDKAETINTVLNEIINTEDIVESVKASEVTETKDLNSKPAELVEEVENDIVNVEQLKPESKKSEITAVDTSAVDSKTISSDEVRVEDSSLKLGNGLNESENPSFSEAIDKMLDLEEVKIVEAESVNLSDSKDDNSDVEEVKIMETEVKPRSEPSNEHVKNLETTVKKEDSVSPPVITLSNTLDILSDDDEEPPKKVAQNETTESSDNKCINLDDDDDIMLIEEDAKDTPQETTNEKVEKPENEPVSETKDQECAEVKTQLPVEKESSETDNKGSSSPKPEENENKTEEVIPEKPKPLVPVDFFKTYRKNLADMTRDDLEEFCILKIVESIIDRSSLNEIKNKIKTMAQNMEEYKKKAMMLTKQNRDLQVVLKSVQEEQKKMPDQPIAPLRITRSVGMQVLMSDKMRRKPIAQQTSSPNTNVNNVNNTSQVNTNTRPVRNTGPTTRTVKPNIPATIPVPKLVPAVNSNTNKTSNVTQTQNTSKPSIPPAPPVKVVPLQKSAEKRTRTQMQSPAPPQPQTQPQSQSFTVDLTDDEPPQKVVTRNVRVAQNLFGPGKLQQLTQTGSSPRKVFIPISGTQGHNIRPGQAIMLKNVPVPNSRPRAPVASAVRQSSQNAVQVRRLQGSRHPAPLPDAMKQYQPPNWKALPPAPDLKLSKVENGIVISWKIEGYQEDSYEEIASYQLYAYQETTSPPSTTLWKKIGDVKALPLPMACTLTQFMAGFKYYFAVRAVDIRSRLGPFSMPGSILLLNKV